MPGPHRPKFSYDSGPTVLTMTWAAREWEVLHGGVGGVRFAAAAAGMAASYVVRRDRDLAITLRVLETERASVETFVEWAQGMESFTFCAGCRHRRHVVLLHPRRARPPGSRGSSSATRSFRTCSPSRIVLRKSDGSQWTDAYFT